MSKNIEQQTYRLHQFMLKAHLPPDHSGLIIIFSDLPERDSPPLTLALKCIAPDLELLLAHQQDPVYVLDELATAVNTNQKLILSVKPGNQEIYQSVLSLAQESAFWLERQRIQCLPDARLILITSRHDLLQSGMYQRFISFADLVIDEDNHQLILAQGEML